MTSPARKTQKKYTERPHKLEDRGGARRKRSTRRRRYTFKSILSMFKL